MNFVIDIGNTRVKTAVFEQNTMLTNNSFLLNNFSNNIEKTLKTYRIKNAIISSVGNLKEEYIQHLSENINLVMLNSKTKVPFINKYKTPETLGVDRIALVAAAVQKYPKENVLIIDSGTCITYDFINEENEYSGGFISPGIKMRYKSLNSFTANLPHLQANDIIPKIGDSTKNAIHIGILNGVIQEIEGTIRQFMEKKRKLTVVLTGGDTIFLARNIKSTIFANPNFLLEGLNSILIYNIDI